MDKKYDKVKMIGTSIWLTKDRRRILSDVLFDYDQRKLKNSGDRFEFQQLKKQIKGIYERW